VDDGTKIRGYSHSWRQDGTLLVGLLSDNERLFSNGIGICDVAGNLLKSFADNATLSPNGDLLALTTGPIERDGTRFFQTVIQATSSGQVLWTLDNVSAVTFSPDSRWIAFDSFICCENKLWVLDASLPGSTPQFVATARGIQQRVWSPDSQKLAFTHRLTEQSGADVLAVFDVRTPNLTTIAPDAANIQWFPDSERLLFDTGPR